MIAKLPVLVQDVVDLIPLVGFLGAMTVAALKRQRNWVKKNISDPIAQQFEVVTETRHLVRHHLGNNGETTPIHERVGKIESYVEIHKRESSEGHHGEGNSNPF